DTDEIEDADPLVIEREEPRRDALVVGQVIVVARVRTRLNDVGGSGSHSWFSLLLSLDERDERVDFLVRELALERWHRRRKALDELRLRVEDRLTDVVFVDRDGRAV